MEILLIIGKTLLFYFLLILILRIMGKREVGELSIFDIVVFFLISELFSLAIDNDTKVINVLIPIGVIVLLQLLTSRLALKSSKIRELIDGKPVLIINKGVLNQKELKKQRYSIDDLLLQIRSYQIDTIEDIEYAILETNGNLSVILKDSFKTKYPFPIIQDGELNIENLKAINKSEQWLINELRKRNIFSYKEVFITLAYKNDLFVIKKETNNKE